MSDKLSLQDLIRYLQHHRCRRQGVHYARDLGTASARQRQRLQKQLRFGVIKLPRCKQPSPARHRRSTLRRDHVKDKTTRFHPACMGMIMEQAKKLDCDLLDTSNQKWNLLCRPSHLLKHDIVIHQHVLSSCISR